MPQDSIDAAKKWLADLNVSHISSDCLYSICRAVQVIDDSIILPSLEGLSEKAMLDMAAGESWKYGSREVIELKASNLADALYLVTSRSSNSAQIKGHLAWRVLGMKCINASDMLNMPYFGYLADANLGPGAFGDAEFSDGAFFKSSGISLFGCKNCEPISSRRLLMVGGRLNFVNVHSAALIDIEGSHLFSDSSGIIVARECPQLHEAMQYRVAKRRADCNHPTCEESDKVPKLIEFARDYEGKKSLRQHASDVRKAIEQDLGYNISPPARWE